MRKKIEVKWSHIKHGEIEQPTSCPIALALKDAFNNSNLRVDVCPSHLIFYDRRFFPFYRVKLPRSAQEFINKFDDFEDVKPFTFYLNLSKKIEEKFTA